MPSESVPPPVRIAFVPFCVASLTRAEINRVFNAHGIKHSPNENPYSKTNLVDAYCNTFDWRNEEDVEQFLNIISDVLSLGKDRDGVLAARDVFLAVCTATVWRLKTAKS